MTTGSIHTVGTNGDYPDFNALIAEPSALQSGDTVQLTSDVTGDFEIPDGITALTLDGQGHTITGQVEYWGDTIDLTLQNVHVINTSITGGTAVYLRGVASVTVQGNCSFTSQGDVAISLFESGTVVIEGSCTINAHTRGISGSDRGEVDVKAGARLSITASSDGIRMDAGTVHVDGTLDIRSRYDGIEASDGDLALSGSGIIDVISEMYNGIKADGQLTSSFTGNLSVESGEDESVISASEGITFEKLPRSIKLVGEAPTSTITGFPELVDAIAAGGILDFQWSNPGASTPSYSWSYGPTIGSAIHEFWASPTPTQTAESDRADESTSQEDDAKDTPSMGGRA